MNNVNKTTKVYLQCVAGQHAGQRLPVNESLVLGAANDADISIDDTMVQAQHARIGMADNQWSIENLSGTDELWVNGAKVTNLVLRSGDEIRLGKQRFVVKMPGLRPDSVLREIPAQRPSRIWLIWAGVLAVAAGGAAYWYYFLQ